MISHNNIIKVFFISLYSFHKYSFLRNSQILEFYVVLYKSLKNCKKHSKENNTMKFSLIKMMLSGVG